MIATPLRLISPGLEAYPILLVGRGCGTIRQGRSIQYGKETPLNNLWASMLNRMDIRDVQFGNSSGELKKLV